MKDLTPDQYMRVEACKVILELVKAERLKFEGMDDYKQKVTELVDFMKS